MTDINSSTGKAGPIVTFYRAIPESFAPMRADRAALGEELAERRMHALAVAPGDEPNQALGRRGRGARALQRRDEQGRVGARPDHQGGEALERRRPVTGQVHEVRSGRDDDRVQARAGLAGARDTGTGPSALEELGGSLATVQRSLAARLDASHEQLLHVRDAVSNLRLVPAASLSGALQRARKQLGFRGDLVQEPELKRLARRDQPSFQREHRQRRTGHLPAQGLHHQGRQPDPELRLVEPDARRIAIDADAHVSLEREDATTGDRMPVDGGNDRDGHLECAHHQGVEAEDERSHPRAVEADQRGEIEAGAERRPLAGDHRCSRLAELREQRLEAVEELGPDGIGLSVLQPQQRDVAMAFDTHRFIHLPTTDGACGIDWFPAASAVATAKNQSSVVTEGSVTSVTFPSDCARSQTTPSAGRR